MNTPQKNSRWTPQAILSIIAVTITLMISQNCSMIPRKVLDVKKDKPFVFQTKPQLVGTSVHPIRTDHPNQLFLKIDATFNNPLAKVTVHRMNDCSDQPIPTQSRDSGFTHSVTTAFSRPEAEQFMKKTLNVKAWTYSGQHFCFNQIQISQNVNF